jgi:hypothetical protein
MRSSNRLFASAIFLGAFLLFQIQPLIAKRMLPWFGGAASVWTASMLFFQVALLCGYLYAHLLARRLSNPLFARLHLLLLVGSVCLLPVMPAAHWKPRGDEEPVTRILLLLGSTIGLQYVLLASASPLLQAMWTRQSGGQAPYRWYGLSNAGSLLGLLTYPVLIEPLMGIHLQASIWSLAYCLYAVLIGVLFLKRVGPEVTATYETEEASVPHVTQAAWILLPAAASIFLLAATGYVSENIMPVPLVWVLPLSAYLLSFVVCFGKPQWYKPGLVVPLTISAILGAASLVQFPWLGFHIVLATGTVTIAVFLVSTYCHGEVFRRRPSAGGLTRFYLFIAAGGAAGGALISVVAPLLLPLPIDFPLAVVICAVALVIAEWGHGRTRRILPALALIVVAGVAFLFTGALAAGTLVLARNFYGALRVTEKFEGTDPKVRTRVLTHGVIVHGSQMFDPKLRNRPTTYYGYGSGVHLAIEQTRRPNQRVGIIGLGTGTLAAYGRAGDVYRFYEINPQVVRLATTAFTYLSDSPARVEVSIGDARLVLEREQPQGYDLLVVDAFSSDTIPAHLLTREAMTTYLRHVRPDGMLAFHVSNKVLRLIPVVAALAEDFKLSARAVDTADDPKSYRQHATWILLYRDRAHSFLGQAVYARSEVPVWTDDYSSIWRIIR